MAARLIMLALFGIVGGALANHVIYRWCYFPRAISVWGPVDEKAPARMSSDRIPILGWLGMRREATVHGGGFWVRPMLIEIGLACALPALYWMETQTGGLLPVVDRIPGNIAAFEKWGTRIFFGHAILLLLMTAATFIDFDEQTIPDIITIPGTIVALILGAISTMGFMPADVMMPNGTTGLMPTTFDLPRLNPIAPWCTTKGLVTGLAIWSAWCFALADRRVILRKGFAKAVEFFFAGLVRYPTWKLLAAIWIVGTTLISWAWWTGAAWHGLFSALVGLAVGGGIVWAIRIVASGAMRVEAMGFGDVTLMAMIGAFLGWQGAVAAFFLSPFAAIAIIIVQYIITRNPRVPFGPYLCAGAVLTIVYWDTVYNQSLAPNFQVLGPMMLWMCLALLGLMGVMLFVWRLIKEAMFR